MKLKITFSNPGGELDSRVVTSDDDAAETFAAMAVEEMLADAGGTLRAGDTFTIEEVA